MLVPVIDYIFELNRDDLVIATEDDATAVHLTDEAERPLFTVERSIIDPYRSRSPAGDAVVHIAGLHPRGSVGAAHYLTEHVADPWAEQGENSFSMVLGSEFDELSPTTLKVLVSPHGPQRYFGPADRHRQSDRQHVHRARPDSGRRPVLDSLAAALDRLRCRRRRTRRQHDHPRYRRRSRDPTL